MKRCMFVLFAGIMQAMIFAAKPIKQVFDADIKSGDEVVWSADTLYLLKEVVVIDSVAKLSIDAGTTILGGATVGSKFTALVVARHGKLFATGTSDKPVIFTAESDTGNQPLPLTTRGLWGGVVILGNGIVPTATGWGEIPGLPSNNKQNRYGGDDEYSSSGKLQFVSIRYAGVSLGSGKTLSGLTLAALGNTGAAEQVKDYNCIEVYNAKYDGIKVIGGNGRLKYLVSAFPGGAAFSFAEGCNARAQFLFGIQRDDGNGEGALGVRHEGGNNNPETMSYDPMIYNLLCIGPGKEKGLALEFKNNGYCNYYNSILCGFKKGVTIEDLTTGSDCRERLDSGNIKLDRAIWHDIGGNTLNDIAPETWIQAHLNDYIDSILDPGLKFIDRGANKKLYPITLADGPAYQNTSSYVSSEPIWSYIFYKGAFDGTDNYVINWADKWSMLSQRGFLDPAFVGTVSIKNTIIQHKGDGITIKMVGSNLIINKLPVSQGAVSIRLFDVRGRLVATIVNGSAVNTRTGVVYDISSLSKGIYLLRCANGIKETVISFTVL